MLCCARLYVLWQLPLLFSIFVEGDKESWWDSGERKTVAYWDTYLIIKWGNEVNEWSFGGFEWTGMGHVIQSRFDHIWRVEPRWDLWYMLAGYWRNTVRKCNVNPIMNHTVQTDVLKWGFRVSLQTRTDAGKAHLLSKLAGNSLVDADGENLGYWCYRSEETVRMYVSYMSCRPERRPGMCHVRSKRDDNSNLTVLINEEM